MCDRIYKILHSDTWVGLFVHRKLYIAFLECNSFRPIYVLIQKGGGVHLYAVCWVAYVLHFITHMIILTLW